MATTARIGGSQPPIDRAAASALPEAAAQSRADSFAHAVSAVLSPPALAAFMIVIAAAATRSTAAWPWAGAALTLGILAPIGYLLWLYERGLVSDLDVQRRAERPRPLAFTLTALAFSATALWLGSAPALLRGLSVAHLTQTTLVLAITLRWKISMHGAAIAACAALLLYLAGPQAAPALVAVPLVAWSRIRLRRHTPGQTVAGAALGGLVMWNVLRWVAMK
jgi:membrane-associated phospholipid phosphatase